jgi:putative transposase
MPPLRVFQYRRVLKLRNRFLVLKLWFDKNYHLCKTFTFMIMKQRKPNRLKQFNYSYRGYYFVTICTKNKEEFFGLIQNKKMVLSIGGEIANRYWQEIPLHFSGIKIDSWVIMPNHIHGILKIVNPKKIEMSVNSLKPVVNSLRPIGGTYMCPDFIKPIRNTTICPDFPFLSRVIQQFKAAVTRVINRIQEEILFQWQRSFFDRVIFNRKELDNIREYIHNNPMNWLWDDENPQKIIP